MDFKVAREQRELTLKQVSTLAGYSIPTINALELEGRGSDRLREKLLQIYALKDTGESPSRLSDVAAEPELEKWRRRALAAEKDLSNLRSGLKKLLANSEPLSDEQQMARLAAGEKPVKY